MYAIEITQENKQLNNIKEVVGTIKIYTELPKVWSGIMGFQYHKNVQSFGFYPYEKTKFNYETEKLGELKLNDGIYSEQKILLSDDEINENFKETVPLTAKNMKLRLALINAGISLQSVNDIIDSITDVVKKEQLYTMWNFADFFERYNSDLIHLTKVLGFTEKTLDDLFIDTNNF